MNKITKLSYFILAGVVVMVGWVNLGTPFLTVLFSTFTLRKLSIVKKNWLAVVIFIVLVCLIFSGFVSFIKSAVRVLPGIVSAAVPKVVEYAKQEEFNIPFTDLDSFKELASESITQQLGEFAKFAQFATKEFVFLIIGLVIGVSIFLNGKLEVDPQANQKNLYSLFCAEISRRFVAFYQSFNTVLGAQIVISSINTAFTGVFVFFAGFAQPTPLLIIVLTFLCGLLPIIGNLISNSIIIGIALTVSPSLALGALAFLVGIHKLEYFLNSKIIGGRIKSPMWLTLLGLIVGERLMGIPGMILAPVVLHYVRVEMSKVEIIERSQESVV